MHGRSTFAGGGEYGDLLSGICEEDGTVKRYRGTKAQRHRGVMVKRNKGGAVYLSLFLFIQRSCQLMEIEMISAARKE